MDRSAEAYRRFREENDESGLVDIICAHKDGLIMYLQSIVSDFHTAEELAIDTFALLGVKKPRDSGKSSFRTWLYAIGRNQAIDYLRRRKSRKETPFEDLSGYDDGSDFVERYITKERDVILHKALGELNPEHRQILWLIYFENMSIREAAEIMHKSTHAAETAASRARAALREALRKEGMTDYEN